MENIGRYRIVAELGRGGGGVVYKGVDPDSKVTVAIKTVPFTNGSGGALVQRLRREAQSASILAHRNIVRVLEFADDGPHAYFVMEFVEGATLEHSMRSGERIAMERALSIIGQTADALDYAHNRGIVHRDIKPANIMMTADGVVKVADFGTAKMLDAAGTQLTVAGSILGSPHYMAPEQVTESGVDGRSDQFSLAVIAYELLSGRKPFEGELAPAVLYQIVSEPAPPLPSLRPELPADADAVLQKALAKNPAGRYASCGEFASALRSALGQPAPVALGPGPAVNGHGWRIRLRRWLTFWK